MSLVHTETRTLANGGSAAILTLAAPRANALEPGLLTAINAALDAAQAAEMVVLTSAGRNFSSGGDVGAFASAFAEGRAVDYARTVVPPLQDLVYRLVSGPQIVGLAGGGAITGGSAGFLFAADTALLAPEAFVQPYYAQVGFAPDGGWSALLPQIIGPAHALRLQISNRRVDAAEAVTLGLAQDIADQPLNALLTALGTLDIGAARTAKRLIWTDARLAALRTALDAETEAFLHRIALPDTQVGMARFLNSLATA